MNENYMIHMVGDADEGFTSPTPVPRNVLILLGYMDELSKKYADRKFSVSVERQVNTEEGKPVVDVLVAHEGTPAEIIDQARGYVLDIKTVAQHIGVTVKQLMSQSSLQAVAVTLVSVVPDGRQAVGSFTLFTQVPPAGEDVAAMLLRGMVDHGTKFKEEISAKLDTQKKVAEGLSLA